MPSGFTRYIALQISAVSELTKGARRWHDTALSIDPKTPFSNYARANRNSDGGLHTLVRISARIPGFFQTFKKLGYASESLDFQDLVFCHLFADILEQPGYFVEIGVGDGQTLSNTWVLEKAFGWNGLLVEANPRYSESIREKRSASLDSRAALDRHDTLSFVDDGLLGGLADYRTYESQRMHPQGTRIEVECAPVEEIFAAHGAPDVIDFLSMDTEGSEREILRAMDFGKRRYRCMSIEHNHDPERKAAYREILEPHGYRQVLENASGIDSMFIGAEEVERVMSLIDEI